MPCFTDSQVFAAPRVVRDGVGPSLSMTMMRVAKAVPYFWYSRPWMRTLARTLYLAATFSNHLPEGPPSKVAPPLVSSARPPPRIATSRPPGSSRCRAESTWLNPYWLRFFAACDLMALAEKGGFITTTVGFTVRSSREFKISPSCADGLPKPIASSMACRRSAISLTCTSAPMALAQTARPPLPAEGSRTTSFGVIAARRETT